VDDQATHRERWFAVGKSERAGRQGHITRRTLRTGARVRDPAKNHYCTPFTIYDPRDGSPITAYGLNANATASRRPTDNLDTLDPERKRIYNAFNWEFRARPGGGIQLFGGMSIERQPDVNCTSPDNPNSLRFCNDRENGIPFSKTFKIAGKLPAAVRHHVQRGASEQSAVTADNEHHDGQHDVHARDDAVSVHLSGTLPRRSNHRAIGDHEPDVPDRRARSAAIVLLRTDHTVPLQGVEDLQVQPRVGAADLRDVQREQLGRDHQLPVDEHSVGAVPGAEFDHAATDDWDRCSGQMVTTITGCIRQSGNRVIDWELTN
jgi:hypothetical protein